MDKLETLRRKASIGVIALLWIGVLAIGLRHGLREAGFDPYTVVAGFAVAASVTLGWWQDRTGAMVRVVSSVAHAAITALLVYSFAGSSLQIDVHMYFFATLAICAAWIDWRAIIANAAFVAVHHLLLYFVMPLAVFPGASDFSRVLMHAVILVLQAGALIFLTHSIHRAVSLSQEALMTANLAEAEARQMAQEVRKAESEAQLERSKREAEKAGEVAAVQTVVQDIDRALSALAKGDLAFRIESRFAGEFDQLRRSFNGSVENLEDFLRQVVLVVNSVREGALQISSANADLSSRTERQAASVQRTSRAVGDLAGNARDTAKVAETVGAMVMDARQGAERSGVIVTNAVEAMGRIEGSSQQIHRIISVIDDIAFQTNLLALNAGVEAARAGDAGRGFAVVAQEVRDLAQRSAQAAREIKGLITQSGEEVRKGVRLVDETGEALRTICEEVVAVGREMDRIVTSIRQQADGLSQIDEAIGEVDRNTHQNAAMVEQSTAALNSLSQEANRLEELMAKFALASEGSAARVARRAA